MTIYIIGKFSLLFTKLVSPFLNQFFWTQKYRTYCWTRFHATSTKKITISIKNEIVTIKLINIIYQQKQIN